MKHRKKIRRGAILALVLVLLLNTMGVQAGTGAPSITVNSYVGLYTTLSTPVVAPEQAESPQESPNWVEIVTMILLAVLVLAELRDKIRAH